MSDFGSRIAPSSRRAAFLFGATLSWLWAAAEFPPWLLKGSSLAWSHDLVFYAKFLLAGWWLLEAVVAVRAWAELGRLWAGRVLTCTLLALPPLTLAASFVLEHTELGWRARVWLSMDALKRETSAPYSDLRHRAGWFIVDSRRYPCDRTAWLWLGQPFGGGHGTSLVLAYDEKSPLAPFSDAFRFLPLGEDWWLGFQHSARFHAGVAREGDQQACEPTVELDELSAGLEFVSDGRAALPAAIGR